MPDCLYATFLSDGGTIRVARSDNGTNWKESLETGQRSTAAGAQVYFKDRFWAVFTADDGSNEMRLCASVDTTTWSEVIARIGQSSAAAPALAVFNDCLCLAFLSNDSSNQILACSSPDGHNWSRAEQICLGRSGCAPSLAVFDDRIWLGFVQSGGSQICTCSAVMEQGSLRWSQPTATLNYSEISPSLAAFDGKLWIAYVRIGGSQELAVTWLSAGTQQGHHPIPVGQVSIQPPFLAVFNKKLWMSAVDRQKQIQIAGSADGRGWAGWTTLAGGSKADVSLWSSGPEIPEPPPPTAYHLKPSDQRVFAGYLAIAPYLNRSARKVFRENPSAGQIYINRSDLPFQNPASPRAWMTDLWDYSQEGGVYAGLRGKWLSNIIIPETHDSMAIYFPARSQSWGEAQDRPFGDQLSCGIRSFDMRYVWDDGAYVGSHFFAWAQGGMQSCISALAAFFSNNAPDRSHELIVLKLRYGTGQNTERPFHTDDDALAMYRAFVNALEDCQLQDRVLIAGQDAADSPLPDSWLPFATLDMLNSGKNGSRKNLLLTIQPDYLVDAWNERYPSKPYFRRNSALETPGSNRFGGPTSLPRFGISVIGIDVNGTVPDRDGSNRLAAGAADTMLYNPLSPFLSNKDINNERLLLSRNDYGGPWNYNFVSANFFEETPFVNNAIEMNKFNVGTDLYDLDTRATLITVCGENGQPQTASIPAGRYYGSLQVARAVEIALNTLAPKLDLGVGFDGNFSIFARTTTLSSAVAVTVSQGKYVEVFGVGTDGALWRMRQMRPGEAPWSQWHSLNGRLTGTPSVVQNTDGRLQVFARGLDDALHYNCQESAGSDSWGGWVSLGGVLRSDPAAAVNADGHLEVFVRGIGNEVYHIWQNKPGDNNSWVKDFNALGGKIAGAPTVVRNVDGTLQVFATGIDGMVVYIRQEKPNVGPWVPPQWQYVPRAINPITGSWAAVGTPAVTVHSNPKLPHYGEVEVFVLGGDNRVHTTILSSANWVKGWMPFDGFVASEPVIGVNTDDRLELFTRGVSGDLQHVWRRNQDLESWIMQWESLCGNLASRPAVTRNVDGRLEVFAPDADYMLKHKWQTPGGPGPWSEWSSLSFPGNPPKFQVLETELSKRMGFGRGDTGFDWKITAGETMFPDVHYTREKP